MNAEQTTEALISRVKADESAPRLASAATFPVAVVNRSTVVSETDLALAVAALQRQVSEHFAPVWGVDARLTLTTTPGAADWWLVILDDADQAGALGYHDLTDAGLPLGKVFAGTDKKYGHSWTVTASHELLEMLVDPYINLAATVETTAGLRLYAYEVADACEADEYGYLIDGVLVSDFVYPAWFEPFWGPGQTIFDHERRIDTPLKLLPGGYISIFDVTGGQGWTQLTAELGPMRYASRPHVGSRRERRRVVKGCWQRSDARA